MVYLRPKRPARKPPEELEEPEFSRVQVHHWLAGTEALTWSMCWPQPAQVVFPQLLHFTGRHMVFPFGSPASLPGVGGECCRREYPLGYQKGKVLGCGVPLFAGFVTLRGPKRAVGRGSARPSCFAEFVPTPRVLQSLMSEIGQKAALNSAKRMEKGGCPSLAALGRGGAEPCYDLRQRAVLPQNLDASPHLPLGL